jgi:hypothetical protein
MQNEGPKLLQIINNYQTAHSWILQFSQYFIKKIISQIKNIPLLYDQFLPIMKNVCRVSGTGIAHRLTKEKRQAAHQGCGKAVAAGERVVRLAGVLAPTCASPPPAAAERLERVEARATWTLVLVSGEQRTRPAGATATQPNRNKQTPFG